MQKHLLIVVYFISFTLGFSFLILGLFLWLNNKQRTFKYLILSALALTLILLEQMVTAYDRVNGIESRNIYYIATYISSIGCGLMIYAITILIRLLIKRSITKKVKLILTGMAVLCLLLVTGYVLTGSRIIILSSSLLIFGTVLYNILLLLANMDSIDNVMIKNIVRRIIAISLLMLPVLFIDTLIEKLPGIGAYFPFGLLSVILYYLVLSGTGLLYIIKNYNRILALTNEVDNKGTNQDNSWESKGHPDHIWESFNITGREREIIRLLVNGYSYNEISSQLMISLPTVKTHVHNIYKKLGIKNKIELINLISQHE